MDTLFLIAVGLGVIGSACGFIHYVLTKDLIEKAWENGKWVRVLLFLILLGPLVWVVAILFATLSRLPGILVVLTMYFLQEVPKDMEEQEELPKAMKIVRMEENNDQVSD